MPWSRSAASSPPVLMNNEEEAFISDLRALRPRPPSSAVSAALARELAPPTHARRSLSFWATTVAAVAACFVAAFYFLGATPLVAPVYELVRAEQPPATIDLFDPVRLSDGTFVRPVRVRWSHQTQWEDRQTNTRLINYQPSEQFALIPLETY